MPEAQSRTWQKDIQNRFLGHKGGWGPKFARKCRKSALTGETYYYKFWRTSLVRSFINYEQ